MKKLKMITVVSVLLPLCVFADISGIGYAQTKQEAKKEALADLCQTIKSEVRSNFESTQTDENTTSKSNIKISSNLPILGAEFTLAERYRDIEANVKLSPQSVNKLYETKLQNLNLEIDSLISQLPGAMSSSSKLKIYEDIFSLLNEFDRYESVGVVLGIEAQKRPSITKAQVQTELANLQSNIDSLAMASKLLAANFKEKKIFVYPPLLQNTKTVADFGSVFEKELKSKVNSVKNPAEALYFLVGEYSLTEDAMVLNYELLNVKTNEVVKSKTVTINKKAYKKITTQPKNVEFDMLLNSGIATSNDLKVSLNSNRGSEHLLFKDAEEIELFVKLNKMGYIYVVGYTQTKNSKLSYLLELQEGEGDSKFIKFINADDANHWVSLGAFTVEPPFGVESIQVIASNKKVTSLPNVVYDEKSGYYVVSNDIKKALVQTRGLKKKVSEKVEVSEDVMSFVTMKK